MGQDGEIHEQTKLAAGAGGSSPRQVHAPNIISRGTKVLQREWKRLSYACPSLPSDAALEDAWGSPLHPNPPGLDLSFT